MISRAQQAEATPPALVPALLVAALAAVWLLPGLGDHGLWSDAELPVLDRALAALGEARTGMLRQPVVPEALRTAGVSLFGDEVGVRLPHALAAVATAAACAWLAIARGLGHLGAAVAAAVVVSMPVFASGGRTAIGNPFGECFGAWALVFALLAARPSSPLLRGLLGSLSVAALVTAVASAGLVPGGVITLVAIATMAPPASRIGRWAVGVAVAVSGAVAIMLVAGQADGYIPLLGASKDLELVAKPELRRFSAALADLGHQSFPWLPVGLVGIALGRDRGLGAWLVGGIVIASAWSLHFGRVDVPLRVPVALATAAAVGAIADPQALRAARRAGVLLAALGIMVVAKDLELVPQDIAAPMFAFAVNEYPADALHTAARLGGFAKAVALALVAGLVLARKDGAAGPIERLLGRVRAAWRDAVPAVLVVLVAVAGSWLQSRTLLIDTSAKLSPKRVLTVFAALAEQGTVASVLATHRVRDRGLSYYGPAELEALSNRRDMATRLGTEAPQAMLMRTIDLAPVYQQLRSGGLPMYVLDDSHATLRLVSNVLPEGMTDRNRIPEVLSTSPYGLEHETLVRYEEFVEVVGWEVDGPIVRGREHTLKLELRVLRPLPGGAKIFARFVGGRLSRMNPDPQPLAEDFYPCNLWRAGDHVLHRYTFVAPMLEILPGEYDFVIGLRRGETKNYTITVPEGETGEFDVRIEDPKRAFAKIGRVQVW